MFESKSMSDVWSRLKAVGYDRDFVLSTILPEWWEDKLANVPSNRALAEMTIARQLNIPLGHLQNPNKKLSRPKANGARLRKWSSAARAEVAPIVQVASRLAQLVALGMRETSQFQGLPEARTIRDEIFSASPSRLINLSSLLNYCWQRGLPVAPLGSFPRQGKKIIGLAAIYEQRPVIILASQRDALPWLAFDLAHELGHVALKHVSVDKFEVDVESRVEAKEEQEADAFARELLFGVENFSLSSLRWRKAEILAGDCLDYQKVHRLDAGLLALNYGKTMNQWPTAESAVRILDQHRGAQKLVRSYFAKNFFKDDLPESSRRFVAATTGVKD